MDERCVVLNGELSLETTAAILLPLEHLWDPLAVLGLAHFDLSGVTFIWPAAITLLTTTVLCLRQAGIPRRRGASRESGNWSERISSTNRRIERDGSYKLPPDLRH